MSAPAHWFISVGELSGDLLAANLVRELRSWDPDLQFTGIVGPSLMAEGVQGLGQLEELNVMGAVEVLGKLASIKILKNRILNFIDRNSISVAILVDFADFHMKLAEELKMRGVKVIQYVAPKLWAWREHRITQLAANTDLVLATFPFEKAFFKDRGVRCEYIGCPIAERTKGVSSSKQSLGFAQDKALIALLPGSRMQELKRLLLPMLAIAEQIKQRIPDAQFIIPVAASLRDSSNAQWFASLEQEHVRFVTDNSLSVMHAADVALVASGTATLECALVGTPMVVIYTMNALSFYLAQKYVKVPWASLVNILRKKMVVREFIQNFSSDEVAEEMCSLMPNSPKRETMLEEFKLLRDELLQPSQWNAVQAIHQLLS